MDIKRKNEIMDSVIKMIREINAAYGTGKKDEEGNYSENVYFREIDGVTHVYADENCTMEVRKTYYELPELYHGNLFFDTPRFEKISRIELSFSNGNPHLSLYITTHDFPVCRVWFDREEGKEDYKIRGISDEKIIMLANVLIGECKMKPVAKAEDKIYYIDNSVDEWHHSINGYFQTFDAAKEALKDCADWFRPKGTGRIYSIGFGLDIDPVLEYENR